MTSVVLLFLLPIFAEKLLQIVEILFKEQADARLVVVGQLTLIEIIKVGGFTVKDFYRQFRRADIKGRFPWPGKQFDDQRRLPTEKSELAETRVPSRSKVTRSLNSLADTRKSTS